MSEHGRCERRCPKVSRLLFAGLLLVVAASSLVHQLLPASAADSRRPELVGWVTDPLGEPVQNAEVSMYADGMKEPIAVAESQGDGEFALELPEVPFETLSVDVSRPHFHSQTWSPTPDELELLSQGVTIRLPDITMERRITLGFWVATLTFVGMLALIALERLHNTMAALLGAAIVLGVSSVGSPLNPNLFILDFEQALE